VQWKDESSYYKGGIRMATKEQKNDAVVMKAGFSEDGKVQVLKIKCTDGVMHRLKVETGGKVILLDHADDEIEAEMVMAKLGGRPCECVRFLMWEKSNPRKKP